MRPSSEIAEGAFAHSLPDRPVSEWQPLRDHLEGVAELSGRFASAFGAADWGRWAGLGHDLGKFSDAFQGYLRSQSDPDAHAAEMSGRTDHATAGAQYAVESLDVPGHLLAYALAGHHSGLLDGRSERWGSQEKRLAKDVSPWEHGLRLLSRPHAPVLPEFVRESLADRPDPFVAAFFTRFLYSALVDADFLDTERFMDPERAAERPDWPEDVLEDMARRLDAHVDSLGARSRGAGVVDRQRDHVRRACLDAADRSPGLFSLTVPTGGGKTLSSLAFALRHAIRHGLRRVVYVIPFTSIIEQNARVFREALTPGDEGGDTDPVLEHHSSVDAGAETVRSRLATENWDSPLVVTTSVQFYESLYAARSSRCRKLHNLARAVIVLDEAQTIPVDLLSPCLRALRELASNYSSTIVLCTATQPAIHARPEFGIGLEGVREMVPDPEALYRSLRRVRVEDVGALGDDDLVRRLMDERQALCIVNTRAHARALFEALGPSESNRHLSALMCPQHRGDVLEDIVARLKTGEECRVVSTQLVEAGVDVDFPVVYRARAGLDSIAQAAGRCNRNGRLDGAAGRVFVFASEHTRSERFFSETANCGAQAMACHGDALSLSAIEHYFRLYYWSRSACWDAKGILDEFRLDPGRPSLPFDFGFATAAERFRLIESSNQAVFVPWGKRGQALCDALRAVWGPPGRKLLRQLQRFTVQIPSRVFDDHMGKTLEMIHDRYPVLINADTNYSEHTGLVLDGLDVPLSI